MACLKTYPRNGEYFVFSLMTAQCQKCGKDYKPKRRGGKFCSTSCRVVQHQLIKRGEAWGKPANGDERYLADKLVAVGRSAREALVQVEGLPAAEAFSRLRALVQGWPWLKVWSRSRIWPMGMDEKWLKRHENGPFWMPIVAPPVVRH